jgi:hypothetical protein
MELLSEVDRSIATKSAGEFQGIKRPGGIPAQFRGTDALTWSIIISLTLLDTPGEEQKRSWCAVLLTIDE